MKDTKLAKALDKYLETFDGNMIELDSPKFFEWLETSENRSFRFQYGFAGEQSFTARKETSKKGQGDYWYGYRKVNGKLHKRYIGKPEDVTRSRLQEVAVALDTPSPERIKPVGYINNYVTNELKQAESSFSYLNDYVTKDQLEGCQQRLTLELEENKQLASKLVETQRLQQQLEMLAAENTELRAHRERCLELPDLEAFRDRFLARLPVGKQAPEHKRTKKVLDGFIAFISLSKS